MKILYFVLTIFFSSIFFGDDLVNLDCRKEIKIGEEGIQPHNLLIRVLPDKQLHYLDNLFEWVEGTNTSVDFERYIAIPSSGYWYTLYRTNLRLDVQSVYSGWGEFQCEPIDEDEMNYVIDELVSKQKALIKI